MPTRNIKLTESQFAFMAKYLRARGLAREGCKLMLVNGLRECDAARAIGVDPVLLAVSVRRYREMYDEIVREFTDPTNGS